MKRHSSYVKTGIALGQWTEVIAVLQNSLALWQFDIGSERVFSVKRAALRPAIRADGYALIPTTTTAPPPMAAVNADIALSRAQFTTPAGGAPTAGRYVPSSVETVLSVGAIISNLGPRLGQLRYFGSCRGSGPTATFPRWSHAVCY